MHGQLSRDLEETQSKAKMSLASYQRQPSTLARDFSRQDPAARHSTWSKSNAAKLPEAKLSQASQFLSTEINHRDCWRVLTDQCPATAHSQRAFEDQVIDTCFWKSEEIF